MDSRLVWVSLKEFRYTSVHARNCYERLSALKHTIAAVDPQIRTVETWTSEASDEKKKLQELVKSLMWPAGSERLRVMDLVDSGFPWGRLVIREDFELE